jgi:hypothetical protein
VQFAVPANTAFELTAKGVLTALQGPGVTVVTMADGPPVPTQIEIPWKLILSPAPRAGGGSVVSSHAVTPATSDVVSRQGTPNPLECELTHWLDRYRILDRQENARTDQDLTGLSFVAKTRGDVGDRPNRAVVEAPFKSDSTERRISVRYTDTKANIVAQLTPLLRQGSHGVTRFERHLHGPERRVIYLDRIVEYHHNAITGVPLKGAAIFNDDLTDRRMVVAQQSHHVFRGRGFREARKAA